MSMTSGKLVQWDNCMLWPFIVFFRSQKCTKIGGKVDNKCYEFFHGLNVRVRLPKDQPRALQEETYSLMQRCFAMCIDGTDDDPCVDGQGIDATIVPHIGWWRQSLYLHSLWTH